MLGLKPRARQALYQLNLVPTPLVLFVSVLVNVAHPPSPSPRLAHFEKGKSGQADPSSVLLHRKMGTVVYFSHQGVIFSFLRLRQSSSLLKAGLLPRVLEDWFSN